MITVYQAVCQNGDYKSPFYFRIGDAKKAALRHMHENPGGHIVLVDQILLNPAALDVVESIPLNP